MTTEKEKAKKYDEALEWMRELYPGLHGATKEDAEHYFPELKESEDERIRKELIELISCMHDADPRKKRWIAWLEKQKPAEYLSKEKVFAIMNKLTSLSFCVPLGSDEEKKIHEITCDVSSLLDYPIEKQKEIPKSADSIPSDCVTDAKCEDRSPKHNISVDEIAQDYIDGVKEYNPEPTWDLMQTAVCYGYNYCEQKEQKPEWSEEDEKMIDHLIEALPMWASGQIAMLPSQADEYVKRLKSLRPQPKQEWKEQKPEAKLTGWVARDKEDDSDSGLGLVLFKGKPRRACNCWIGAAVKQPLTWEMFPDLKWEDEPMEVEITITKK